MKYIATAVLKNVISVSASVKDKIEATAVVNTISPTFQTSEFYQLIDGGAPDTTYVPIEGFRLISGGNP